MKRLTFNLTGLKAVAFSAALSRMFKVGVRKYPKYVAVVPESREMAAEIKAVAAKVAESNL